MNNTILKTLPVGVLLLSTSLAFALPTFDVGITVEEAATLTALDLTGQCPTADTLIELDVGASGIKKYSSITIPANCIVKFTPTGNGYGHSSNPVRLVVTGDVLIDGVIDISGARFNDIVSNSPSSLQGGIGGPGGYDGGSNYGDFNAITVGYGPDGGFFTDTEFNDTASIQPVSLSANKIPLIGGGGGTSRRDTNGNGRGGPGGGGAILIASNGKITLNGTIDASAGTATSSTKFTNVYHTAIGGMIYLIANEVAGTGTFFGEVYGFIETLNNTSSISSITNGIRRFSQLTLDLTSLNATTLVFDTIDGQVVSQDMTLTSTAGFVDVVLSSTGLAAGTKVNVNFIGISTSYNDSAIPTYDSYLPSEIRYSGLLDANGNVTVSVKLPTGISELYAYVDDEILLIADAGSYLGEKIQVARIEAKPGAESVLKFFTETGKAVPDGYVKNPWGKVSIKKG